MKSVECSDNIISVECWCDNHVVTSAHSLCSVLTSLTPYDNDINIRPAFTQSLLFGQNYHYHQLNIYIDYLQHKIVYAGGTC